ncbi:hypothetical protein WMY93_007852 [Mugilogobius chulae]|uniref:ATP synthase subunit epsilon, mitochondrial n=1 Tax=Mugilogobius chulae TaxID=88201 RepID=A0AAW0PJB4_9GOBI
MYKGLLRNLFLSPNTSAKSIIAYASVLKCKKSSSANFRSINRAGAKGLWTSSVQLCEKNEIPPAVKDITKSQTTDLTGKLKEIQ